MVTRPSDGCKRGWVWVDSEEVRREYGEGRDGVTWGDGVTGRRASGGQRDPLDYHNKCNKEKKE